MYTILLVDLGECYCADVYSDAEIKKLFGESSNVPNKHKKGGQSAARFGRLRENEITQWFKGINEKLKPLDREITLGMSDIYKKRFEKYLSTYNKQKIKRNIKSEYSSLTGIYDAINRLEAKKK